MSRKQHGLLLPLAVGVTLVVVAAMLPLAPNVAHSNAQQFSFRHATWWHWQSAALAYKARWGSWPDSLDTLADVLALPSPPDYLSGYAAMDNFHVRWSGISSQLMPLIMSELDGHVTQVSATSVEVVLGNGGSSDVSNNSWLNRHQNAEALTDISLNDFSIVNMLSADVNQLTIHDDTTATTLQANVAQFEQISVPQAVQVGYFSRNVLIAAELEAMLDDVRELHQQLHDHVYDSDLMRLRPSID